MKATRTENRSGRSTPASAAPVDPVEAIRSLAAEFVRAIDATRFAYENVATLELTSRLTALAGLHAMASEEPVLSQEPTDVLRQRLNVIRQIVNARPDLEFNERHMTNGQLRKRVEFFRLFTDAKADFTKLSDVQLDEVIERAEAALRDRKDKRRKEAKAAAQAAPIMLTGSDLVEEDAA